MHFLRELYDNRKLIMNLAKSDFKTKYAGSFLGIIWAFVQPVVTVIVYSIVFQVVFAQADVGEVPYVLWLITGLVPWFFFNDALNGGTNAMIEYNYLVKKVVFKISILPIVKIISALFVHLFFICFTIAIYVICGVLAGIAGIVASSRIYSADANNIGLNLEMDAILAVALGGNFLGGGKFSLIGSVIGAYTIQALTTTLYAMNVKADQLPVYKAIVVVIIVTLQSDVFKKYIANLKAKRSVAAEGGQK